MCEIRVLTAADVESFSRLRLEALENEPAAFASSPEEHRALPLSELRRRVEPVEQGSFIAGAFREGRLLGTAALFRDPAAKRRHKAILWAVYVSPEARGAGLARRLVTAVIERARSYPDLRKITLTVSSPPARKLYESLGFRAFGQEREALMVNGVAVDEAHMELVLAG